MKHSITKLVSAQEQLGVMWEQSLNALVGTIRSPDARNQLKDILFGLEDRSESAAAADLVDDDASEGGEVDALRCFFVVAKVVLAAFDFLVFRNWTKFLWSYQQQ